MPTAEPLPSARASSHGGDEHAASFGGDIVISGGQVNTGGGTLLLHPAGAANSAVKPTNTNPDATANVQFGSDLAINVNSASSYDQLTVTGNVDLTHANLVLSGGYTPVAGDTFTIVATTGGVITGVFTGHAEGSIYTFNGVNLVVHYGTTAVTLTVATVSIVGLSDGSEAGPASVTFTVTQTAVPASDTHIAFWPRPARPRPTSTTRPSPQ